MLDANVRTGHSRATDEDLRLTIIHLVVALVTKLQDTKITVSFFGKVATL